MLKGTAAFIPIARSKGSSAAAFMIEKREAVMTEQTNSQGVHIGFVGVGVMGRPMASNLLKAGFPCTVYDINPAPVATLVAQGANAADSVEEVARMSDIFVTMVVDDAQLASTLFEPGNAVHALKPGSVVIGMSTMSVSMVQ
jgi:3-hydroxyisobutyrate dehydrogenase-like beta-hydroxyacid dehydrogenase